MNKKEAMQHMQKVVHDQTAKVAEILESILAVHGRAVCDKVTIISRMMAYHNQMMVTALSAVELIDRANSDRDVQVTEAACLLLKALSAQMDLGERLPVAVFMTSFNEKEQAELTPFLSAIDHELKRVHKEFSAVLGRRL